MAELRLRNVTAVMTMAEYTYPTVQTVQPNGNVIFQSSIPCNKGYVIHRENSGILTLRGMTAGCNRFARYQVTFNGNIAVPTGGTVGPIAVALSIGGEVVRTSRAIVTPAAVEDYFNVTCTAIIDVPTGCCYNIAIENASPAVEDEVVTVVPINVTDANLVVSRIA